MTTDSRGAGFGVYVHFPWCRTLCPYCDFAVRVPRDAPAHEAFCDAIIAELHARAPAFGGRSLRTIYFGGGTPSWWEPACLADVVAAVRGAFQGVPEEVTIEANPVDCEPARLAAWRQAGINRISIGVQSLRDDELVRLGRDHRHGDGERALRETLMYFTNVSADHILGVPTANGPRADGPSQLAGFGVPHLSVYELTIEAKTKFGSWQRSGQFTPLPDEQLADVWQSTRQQLVALGYEHYEISSYARPGARAVHNSLYWHDGEFLGLGPSAASYRHVGEGAVRETNLRRVDAYLRAPATARVDEALQISAPERWREAAWLALRTSDGLCEQTVSRFAGLSDYLDEHAFAVLQAGRWRPTTRGFLFHGQIALQIALAQWDNG